MHWILNTDRLPNEACAVLLLIEGKHRIADFKITPKGKVFWVHTCAYCNNPKCICRIEVKAADAQEELYWIEIPPKPHKG